MMNWSHKGVVLRRLGRFRAYMRSMLGVLSIIDILPVEICIVYPRRSLYTLPLLYLVERICRLGRLSIISLSRLSLVLHIVVPLPLSYHR